MALAAGELEAIAAAVDDPRSQGLTPRLRAQFGGLTFTLCADDDVIAMRPVVEREAFNLYLVDGSDHCMRLTCESELASGVVVAWKDADDE